MTRTLIQNVALRTLFSRALWEKLIGRSSASKGMPRRTALRWLRYESVARVAVGGRRLEPQR